MRLKVERECIIIIKCYKVIKFEIDLLCTIISMLQRFGYNNRFSRNSELKSAAERQLL